jgi:hypothetical protein
VSYKQGDKDVENNNSALAVLKILPKMIDAHGRVTIDVTDICRATALSGDDLRQCLDDLQDEGYLKIELIGEIAEDWR